MIRFLGFVVRLVKGLSLDRLRVYVEDKRCGLEGVYAYVWEGDKYCF